MAAQAEQTQREGLLVALWVRLWVALWAELGSWMVLPQQAAR